jgi:hypothetical protein
MPERHADWLEHARLDLDHARVAAQAGHFEWAAFAAQQAAEKACATPVPVDLTVCTRAELDLEAAAGNALVRAILTEGVVLYRRSAGPAASPSVPPIR